MRGSDRLFDIIQRLRTASKPTAARRNSRLISKERHAPSIVTSPRCRAAGPTFEILTPSIELAAGQLAAPARYRAPRWFGEALDGVRVAFQ
jgi:hypothetical protein